VSTPNERYRASSDLCYSEAEFVRCMSRVKRAKNMIRFERYITQFYQFSVLYRPMNLNRLAVSAELSYIADFPVSLCSSVKHVQNYCDGRAIETICSREMFQRLPTRTAERYILIIVPNRN
jgi:hypothetical protein